MTDTKPSLESMSCDELMRELARLTSERDHTQAEVGAPTQAGDDSSSQQDAIQRQAARIARIGELLAAKGCAESGQSPAN